MIKSAWLRSERCQIAERSGALGSVGKVGVARLPGTGRRPNPPAS